MKKPLRKNQSRAGSATRRQLEYDVLVHHCRKDKERLIRRLASHLHGNAHGCLVYKAAAHDRAGGYPKISFRYEGQHVLIAACRVFLILKTCAPIPLGFEAGHTCPEAARSTREDKGCVRHLELQHCRENAADNARPQR